MSIPSLPPLDNLLRGPGGSPDPGDFIPKTREEKIANRAARRAEREAGYNKTRPLPPVPVPPGAVPPGSIGGPGMVPPEGPPNSGPGFPTPITPGGTLGSLI